MNLQSASDIAVSGLQYLAGDSEQLSRFVALSGISPSDMREFAQTPEFMIAVLEYFLGDEPTLLAFAASSHLDPADVAKAKHALDPAGSVEF
ncbi:MAG: DUF3572 domain-containing protein [Rhizobiaceae bacterium]